MPVVIKIGLDDSNFCFVFETIITLIASRARRKDACFAVQGRTVKNNGKVEKWNVKKRKVAGYFLDVKKQLENVRVRMRGGDATDTMGDTAKGEST